MELLMKFNLAGVAAYFGGLYGGTIGAGLGGMAGITLFYLLNGASKAQR